MIVNCVVCNKEINIKPYRVRDSKYGICCSRKCGAINKQHYFKGEANPHYGKTGDKSNRFKGSITIMKRGTNRYEFEYLPWHPFAESTGRVRKHRADVERNHILYDPACFINMCCRDGTSRFILQPKYDVHHKNRNTLDNNIDNLEILTRGTHAIEHFIERFKGRDIRTGQFLSKEDRQCL